MVSPAFPQKPSFLSVPRFPLAGRDLPIVWNRFERWRWPIKVVCPNCADTSGPEPRRSATEHMFICKNRNCPNFKATTNTFLEGRKFSAGELMFAIWAVAANGNTASIKNGLNTSWQTARDLKARIELARTMRLWEYEMVFGKGSRWRVHAFPDAGSKLLFYRNLKRSAHSRPGTQ